VERQPVLLRVNSHGAETKFVGGTKNADSDFAAV
jgi:hypothetical protein